MLTAFRFSRLSLGSSYAIATGPSVQEFATTASFGVMEKGKYIENGAQKTDWANEAWVMWANVRSSVSKFFSILFLAT